MIPRTTLRDGLALTILSVATTTIVSLTATPSSAHLEGDHWPLAGKKLQLSAGDASDGYLKFKTTNDLNINPESLGFDPPVPSLDPRSNRSTLVVRGTGVNAGTSELIFLNGNKWSLIGSEEKPKGWRYTSDDVDSHSGGIRKIQIKAGKTTGSLQIQAKGYYWPYAIPGPQDSVEIVLSIGGHAFCATFSEAQDADFKTNVEGKVEASNSIPPHDCPMVCGNGIDETGEDCDDGNTNTDDTCSNECVGCNVDEAEYDTTFEGIQDIIFDGYDCSNDACHGSAQLGGLDLRAGNSYASLVNVASQADTKVRVFPGNQDESVLYLKLAMATLPDYEPDTGGTPMPFSGSVLTEEHLEAIRLWIRGGAPETGVVAETAELLGSCLPAQTPLNIPQPEVPDENVGTQFAMPGYDLANGEVEGCTASYYDLSESVPAEAIVDCPGAFPGTNETGVNAGKCFAYRGNYLYQDPMSHHSIVRIYPGEYSWDDPGWGDWTCHEGPLNGTPCDPTVAGFCQGGVCGTGFRLGVACLDAQLDYFGPPDFDTATSPQFSGSQGPTADFRFPEGVYSILPLKGLIVWNSHAFNKSFETSVMNTWINLTYTANRQYPAQGLFNNDFIFVQNVPPFEQREYCHTHTFDEGTHLFQLTSHTHKRGILWRYFDAPQTPCTHPSSCSPGAGTPFYTSRDYSDPKIQNYDPPKVYSGTVAERTIKFCALYDNGFVNPGTVKRRSQSPEPTGITLFGGPCEGYEARCLGGPSKGDLCHGNDQECPESLCDACPLRGGVTTEDEMFIAIGTYYED
jgi:hypothetical protein